MIVMFPAIVHAQADAAKNIVGKINAVIINPLIVLLFAVAITVFVVGIIEFLANRDNQDSQKKGKSHMMWGLIGIFIMISVWGIIRLIDSSLRFIDPDPSAPSSLEQAGY